VLLEGLRTLKNQLPNYYVRDMEEEQISASQGLDGAAYRNKLRS
jgi:hypothetical protein